MLEEIVVNLISTSPVAAVLGYVAYKLSKWVQAKDAKLLELQKEHSDYLKGLLAEYGEAIIEVEDDE